MSSPERGPGYETRDANIRLAAWIGIGILLILAVAMLLMGGLFRSLTDRAAANQEEPASLMSQGGRTQPPEPRLEADPYGSLESLRSREEVLLNTYGWVDGESDRVRLPIVRAMKLTSERGLPARSEDPDGDGVTP